MKTSILRKILAAMLALALPHAVASDLVDTAAKSSEIKTFVEALKTTGLSRTLASTGPYTVFAPSNSAFNKLPPHTKASLFQDKKKLEQVLSYHVMAGKLLVMEVKPGPAKTLNGSDVNLKSDNGKITVNDANVTLSDIEADNGVIHVIDTVLLPAP
ncbi:MAG TPA: fasciclin domain-containing protein [Noviherbaspirillum sp.]|nr:fasciclin domain-containing protein [Noviherbaspirillum sp.]